MLFTELVGDKLGNFLNILVLLHALAFAYWVFKVGKDMASKKRR